MSKVLEKILHSKRQEIRAISEKQRRKEMRQATVLREEEKRKANSFENSHMFERIIAKPEFTYIFEFKCKSPFHNEIRPGAKPGDFARVYEQCGADAMSVLIDTPHFGGRREYVRAVKYTTDLLVLYKELIVNDIQLYQAKIDQADAVLLMRQILTIHDINRYIDIADSLGIDCVVEVENKEQFNEVLDSKARIIQVNNRQLMIDESPEDIYSTARILDGYSGNIPIISASGMKVRDDVKIVAAAGANAVLIGAASMDIKTNPTLDHVAHTVYALMGKELPAENLRVYS